MLRFVRPLSCASVVAWGWMLVSVFTCGYASAQTDVLNELYGSGVHAYNSGQSRQAYDDLTMAIRSGSKDPRVYYYRGLAYLRLGRPQEAQSDFKKAASMEMADTDHFYPVSKSLERVQGSARAQIERYRSQARLVAYQTRERQRFERYERIRKNEPNVLMPEEATEMPTPAKEVDEEPEPEMPAEKPEPAEKESDEEMPAEEADADKEPAEEMPADEKSDDDPFAEKGDEEMPADEAAEKEEDSEKADESADKKKADDDPFAE